MTKKILTICITVIVLAVCGYAIYYFTTQNKLDKQPSEPTTTEQQQDPARIQREADALLETDPEAAQEKYEEASKLYEENGDIDKQAENDANAITAETIKEAARQKPGTDAPPGATRTNP